MKYTKLFNNHNEYVAYTASTSFIRPNVSWCILEDESHCTPTGDTCIEQHIYEIMGEPSYPSSVPASATSFELSFDYIDSYTAITCDEGTIERSETVSIEIDENPSIEPRTVSGICIFNGISIPYSLTQEGAEITVEDPVISCDGLEITITCATPMTDIYYKLTDIGSYSAYTSAIAITADTDVWCYATLSGVTSNVVTATCEYNPTHDYSKDYLTFNVLSDGAIRWMSKGSNMAKTISYSINDGSWTEITATSAGVTINVEQGDKVRFKGTNSRYASDKSNYSGFDSSGLTNAAQCDIEGNIMSLVYGDNFSGETAMTGTYNFCSIFKASKVVSAENLVLPSTTLTQYCYRAMFSWCTSLIKAPQLPATTLAQGCYWYLFEYCALTTAPDLLAETLVAECYGHMFENCSSLNYIKALATSGFGSSKCKEAWTTGVASNGTFIKSEDVTTNTWSTGVNGIPTNWTVEDESTVKSPTISFDGFSVITLSCETEGADIFYKLNNVGEYSTYTTAIVINEDTFIEAYAELNSESSSTTSQTCVYVSDVPIEYSNRDLKRWQYNGNEIATPYSVNAIDGHSSSYAKGTFNFETSFALREAEPTYLWFQHADQSAEIFVDGVSVEKHWGGYAAFTTDISNYVHSGVNNIKVALKNNEGNNLAPASGDFNLNATLGNVRLLTSPYVPAMNYGYDGFHITSTVSDAEATMNIKTSVPTGATLVCKIDDGNTNIYSATSASTGIEMTFTKVISNPHLWNGTLDPHMYTVTLEIYEGEDLYHRFVRPYGLRYYEYVINDTEKVGTASEPYTGFLLNGAKYLLRGCCMHDDIDGKANALDETDYDTTFATIRDLGVNFLRLAHYPHPKEVYDRCDALGIIVQTEAPCVNNLQPTMPTAYYEHLTGQYTDMVNQHYNHPCIVFWGLSNETQTDDKAFGKQKVEEYTALTKSLDTERLVGYVLAHSQNGVTNGPSGYYNDPQGVDWFGCNMYVGWYTSTGTNNPSSEIQKRLNNTVTRIGKPIAYSEYGGGGTSNCHSDNFVSTTTRGNNPRHDIECLMWIHEGHIAAIKNFPQLISTSQWQLFDIAVASRNEGYTVCLDGDNTLIDDSLRRLNDKGLVERDHVTKKDPFYLYKAWWNTTDKFVHICQKSFTRRIGRTIKCYSNDGDTFKLYVNGTLVETVTANDNIVLFTPKTFNNGDIIKVSGSTSSDEFTMPTSPSYNIVLTTKYNVTDTVNPTIIGGSGYVLSFEEIEIDGVKQQDVISAYTFSTLGEHTVKYKLDNTSIDAYAFNGCSNLVSVDMPNDVTILRDGCFKECTSLTSITMSSGITLIENSAFKGCSSLLEMTLPNNVTKLGEGVFSGCTSLETINIPSGITNFSTSNLHGCYSLLSITVDSGNTTYDSRDNCNAIITTKDNSLIYGCKNTVIPSTVTSIGNLAFQGCSGLTSIDIPNSVTKIESEAFKGCISLSSVTIGSGVTSIGNEAFRSCSSLTSIVSNAITAPSINGGIFNGVHTDGVLTVPIGSSGYDVWMGTGNYYLGKYNWTKVEQ